MDLPAPPKDIGLRNIIDKLAEFVARNGPEFESITKAKQQGNPRFSFLYGGEYYQYYQWRVSSEQAMLKQQVSMSQPPQSLMHLGNNMPGNWPNAPQQPPRNLSGPGPNLVNVANQIESLSKQQNALRDQIRQSEQNLTAQHGVLMQQQQKQVDEAIEKAQSDTISKQAEENNIRLSDFDAILQPIIDSCTKDSISAGKNWILQNASEGVKCAALLQYLLKKALANGVQFTQKLHLIYLVNDVLHHCVRKHADDLKNNLENIVIPMFCSAEIIATEEQKAKLMKLLSLWESKSNFFDACVISKLRSPDSSMKEYKTNLLNTHSAVVSSIQQSTQTTFENYKQQHQVFIQHATQQISMIDSQIQVLKQQQQPPPQQQMQLQPQPQSQPQQQQQQSMMKQIPPLMAANCDGIMNPNSLNGNSMQLPGNNFIPNSRNDTRLSAGPPPLMSQNITLPGVNMNFLPAQQRNNFGNDANYENYQNPEPPAQMQNNNLSATIMGANPPAPASNYQMPPPNFLIPDLSKPPPGFNTPMAPVQNNIVQEPVPVTTPPVPVQEEVKPTAPYYELPAGLMVPLIRLEDCSYRSLDPEDIRLPPPTPPSERLIQAIEAFYSLPSHDRPRDGEGWEKLGLYEYYKVKNAARKIKEEEIEQGIRERSRSPTPIVIESIKPKRIKKRCYRSKSRSKSRSRSRSVSPRMARRGSNNRHFQRLSPKRSNNSPQFRRSQSPVLNLKRDRDRDRDRERVRDRDCDKERKDRSRSPPSSFINFQQTKQVNYIEESNKGHQLLMKMGWGGSGTGLGAQGQGIEAPISGGEVRDKQDMYKGVGMNLNDPYENFRKNKGAAFIHRMRSRDHERKKIGKHQTNTDDGVTDY